MASKSAAFLSVFVLAVLIAIAAAADEAFHDNHENDIVTTTTSVASINEALVESDNVETRENVTASQDSDYTCVYSVYVKTGTLIKAGTDSNIALVLRNEKGDGIKIKNLVAWGGLMGSNYDYFEWGNLDIFSGRGPCFSGRICTMDLISDGTGNNAGWYCDYVDVTSTGPNSSCKKQKFPVNTWIQPPSQLTFSSNRCNSNYAGAAIASVVE